jgi:hypothetical protein
VRLSLHSRVRPRMLLAWALFLGISSPFYCQEASKGGRKTAVPIQTLPIKTSVCEAIAHPENFDGKLVEIEARFSATWEGAWLSDSECQDSIGELVPPEQQGLDKQYADVVRDVKKRFALEGVRHDAAWREFDGASRQLYTGMGRRSADGTTDWGKYDFIIANFTGVLVIRRNFRVRNGFGNGWGHLGASRFLLVWNSVSDVTPHLR